MRFRSLLAAVVFVPASIALGQSCDVEPILIGDNLDLSTGETTNRGHPALVFNRVDGEYLVVWFDSRIAGSNDIYGQLVSHDGILIGDNLNIQVADGSHTEPTVAHNFTDNEFLVTWKWQGGSPGTPGFNNAYGQRVSADGVNIGDRFHVSNGGLEGSIVYNHSENQFMHEARNFAGGGAGGIRGQRISNLGTLVGANITIASTGAPAPAGEIAFDDNNNQYFATWRDQSNEDLRGQLIAANGTLIGGAIIISSTFPSSGSAASVAFDASRNRYLVVFGEFMIGTIYGQFMTADGNPNGIVFTIASGLASSTAPHIAYSGVDDAYFVVWKNGGDIEGQLLLGDGTFCADPLSIVRDTAADRPKVTVNSDVGEFLVAWRDNRNAAQDTHDIFAQLVGIGAAECPEDVNGDGAVDVLDLLAVIAAWGNPGGPEDVNGDGTVDVLDLLAVISAWGPC